MQNCFGVCSCLFSCPPPSKSSTFMFCPGMWFARYVRNGLWVRATTVDYYLFGAEGFILKTTDVPHSTDIHEKGVFSGPRKGRNLSVKKWASEKSVLKSLVSSTLVREPERKCRKSTSTTFAYEILPALQWNNHKVFLNWIKLLVSWINFSTKCFQQRRIQGWIRGHTCWLDIICKTLLCALWTRRTLFSFVHQIRNV